MHCVMYFMTGIKPVSAFYVLQALLYLQLVLADAVNADQLRLEDQHAVGRNWARAPAAVRPVGLDCELSLLTRAHV